MKGKKLQLGDFIGDTGNQVAVGGVMMELPSAPRATTLEIDVSKLPARPPFTAAISNLVYEIEEEDLATFFEDIKFITKIEIPRDEEDDEGRAGRFKGVAFVTVDGNRDAAIESLALILAKNDMLVCNRRARIEIYEDFVRGARYGDDRGGRGGGFAERRDRDPGFGRSDDADDWRRPAAASSEPSRDDRNDRYGGDRYGSDRGGRDDRGSDRYGDRGGRDGDRYGGRDDRDRGYGRDDRGYGRGGDDRGMSSAADNDSSWRRAAPEVPDRRNDDRRPDDRRPPPMRDAPKERPRLQLTKKTVPTGSSSTTTTGSSIFGSAKPIDTAKKEREIEEKLSKMSFNDNRRVDYAPRDAPRSDRDYQRKPTLTADERADQAARDLQRRVESGHNDTRPECDREEVVARSRFDMLDDQ